MPVPVNVSILCEHQQAGDAHQLEAVLPEVGNNGFLHHQVPRETVQFFDDHRAHAVGVERRH